MTRGKKKTLLDEEKAGSDKKSLGRIIDETFSVQNQRTKSIHDYLISLVTDGSLEQQQSKGDITKIAVDLLRDLRGNSNAHNQN